MKRIISLLLIIVMMLNLFCLVCCGKDEPIDIKPTPTPACVHSGGVSTCTQQAICDQCGKRYGELAPHDFVNGTCSICGMLQAYYLGVDTNYESEDETYPVHPTAVDYSGNYVMDDEHRERDMTVSAGALTLYLVTNKDQFDTKDFWINSSVTLQRNILSIGTVDIDMMISLAPDYNDITGRGKISGSVMSVVIDCSIFINGGYIYIGRTFGSNKCAYKLSIEEIVDYIYGNTALSHEQQGDSDGTVTDPNSPTEPDTDSPKSVSDLITDMIGILQQTDLYVVKSFLPSIIPPSKYKYVMDDEFFRQQFQPLMQSYDIQSDDTGTSTPSTFSGAVENNAETVLVLDNLTPIGMQTTWLATIHPEQGDSMVLTTVVAIQEFEYTANNGNFAPPTHQDDYPYIPLEAFFALVAYDIQSLSNNASSLGQ